MKSALIFLTLFSTNTFAESFEVEAVKLVGDLKSSLMKNLTEKIKKEGVEAAIPFCHENVKPIGKEAAQQAGKDYLAKYEFGRSSHKLRNSANQSQEWMKTYIAEFQGTFFDKNKAATYGRFGKLDNGKKTYIEPLFVQAQCLTCHGEGIAPNISQKLKELYPEDQATGFKLNEFRGIVWVKEK